MDCEHLEKPQDKEVLSLPYHQIMVKGELYNKIPQDLYIPPDALEVFLETFTGPLDLLLYLIRKQNFDIVDIPISEVTNQYIEYVELMKDLKLELAAEYLVMAATLAEIKSRMILPRQPQEEEGEDVDPRAELARRLQDYERFKMAAQNLSSLPQVGKDILVVESVEVPAIEAPQAEPELEMKELLAAFLDVLRRSDMIATHKIEKDALSVRERMGVILDRLRTEKYISFYQFFDPSEGRMGVVVTFLAMLELLKESLIDMVQTEAFGPIHLKALDYETDEETHQQTV